MKQFISLLIILGCASLANAQKDPNQMTDKRMDEVAGALKKEGTGWLKGGDLGINVSGSGNRNRRLSDGVNQFGFGGILTLFANQKGTKAFWENSFMLNLATQRNGGKGNPFLKNNDILRLNSTWGYALKQDKIFVALDGRVETQLLETHKGGLLKGDATTLSSRFLAPVNLMLAPGVVYKATPKLSFFVSPAAVDLIYVGDDALASQTGEPLGNERGKNNRLLIGPAVRAKYASTYFKDKVAVNSSLSWNGNYRDKINGRVLWANQANVQIYKGLSLKLVGEIFYDHYTKAVIAEETSATPQKLGLETTFRGGYFLAYSRIFGGKK